MNNDATRTVESLQEENTEFMAIPNHEELDVGYKASIDNVLNAKYQLASIQKRHKVAKALIDDKNEQSAANERYLKILQSRNRGLPKILKMLTCSE